MQLTLSQKQNEYILNAIHRWNLKVGAVRSGKSFVDVAYVVPSRIRAVAGLSGLNVILGVSRDTIERNVLQPMREIYTDELVGNINSSTNIAKVCGEPVYCIGAEKASQVAKIQGSSIKYCYGDEVAKWKKEVFDMLKSRLDKPYSCFDGSLNPENPNHWLKEFLDQDNLDKYIQHYTIDDNPFLSPDYVENIKKEYAGTVYYDRYILGEWALAEGLIYPMYQDALVKELPDGKQKDHVLSIDYGTMNAFATIQWTNIDDIWYGHKNYYYSGRDTGVQKTDNEYLEDIENHFSDLINAYRQGVKEAISMGGYPPSKIKVIIDPSAASFIALLKKTDWAKVQTADNNVLDGIRETASAMHQGKLKIVDNSEMKPWKKEAGGYIWDEKSVEDKPVKVEDHCLTGDTLVMTEHGAKPIEELVGTSGNVWSYNTETGCAELKPYHDCRLTQEMADIYEIETEDGRVIRCTGEHPILTQRGFILAKYLEVSDKIIDIMDAISYNIDKL